MFMCGIILRQRLICNFKLSARIIFGCLGNDVEICLYKFVDFDKGLEGLFRVYGALRLQAPLQNRGKAA